jgi:hypothetical protein
MILSILDVVFVVGGGIVIASATAFLASRRRPADQAQESPEESR